MSFWEEQAGYDTGEAIKQLVNNMNQLTADVKELVTISNNKRSIKYDTPMKIKTFILDNTFSAMLKQQDAEVNEFIKDKHVIDMKITRTDESHIRLMIEYKEVSAASSD